MVFTARWIAIWSFWLISSNKTFLKPHHQFGWRSAGILSIMFGHSAIHTRHFRLHWQTFIRWYVFSITIDFTIIDKVLQQQIQLFHRQHRLPHWTNGVLWIQWINYPYKIIKRHKIRMNQCQQMPMRMWLRKSHRFVDKVIFVIFAFDRWSY